MISRLKHVESALPAYVQSRLRNLLSPTPASSAVSRQDLFQDEEHTIKLFDVGALSHVVLRMTQKRIA